MLFNSFAFRAFFLVVAALTFVVPERMSRGVLVTASFAFYGMWNPMLLLLLGGCVIFNYATGLAIGRLEGVKARRLLTWTVAANLGVLGVFKYAGFFSVTVTNLLGLPPEAFELRVVLPVAISFYTFEAIAYNVDVYHRRVTARTSPLDFALFISFFPHLVAGPIIRPAHFFPQLNCRRLPSGDDITWGVVQVMKGLIKKTVFADNFAVVANAYFDGRIGQDGMAAAWVGVIAFSMQIYFDFSGYTDIARGCARLLGYEFPPNFERPYLARDITEFWRRWHISLSTWLRDYLYIPLGGNRHGALRTYVNLLITMGLGGLWHGASWNFVLWGLYHGVLLALHRAWRGWRGAREPSGRIGTAASVASTFLLVTLGWVTFRAPDFATTLAVLSEMFTGTIRVKLALPNEFPVLLGISALWLALDRERRLQAWLSRSDGGVLGSLRVAASLALTLLAIELFARTDIAVPFIYFQF